MTVLLDENAAEEDVPAALDEDTMPAADVPETAVPLLVEPGLPKADDAAAAELVVKTNDVPAADCAAEEAPEPPPAPLLLDVVAATVETPCGCEVPANHDEPPPELGALVSLLLPACELAAPLDGRRVLDTLRLLPAPPLELLEVVLLGTNSMLAGMHRPSSQCSTPVQSPSPLHRRRQNPSVHTLSSPQAWVEEHSAPEGQA